MLKLTDDGAKITLQNQPHKMDNGLFWFGLILLIGAVAVALAMSILPERLAIGALALLIVGCFVFNRQRQKAPTTVAISGGTLWVGAGKVVHEHHGTRAGITLIEGDQIIQTGEQLQIIDAHEVCKCRISGFESAQEAAAAQAILQGRALTKRHVNIKMGSEQH